MSKYSTVNSSVLSGARKVSKEEEKEGISEGRKGRKGIERQEGRKGRGYDYEGREDL